MLGVRTSLSIGQNVSLRSFNLLKPSLKSSNFSRFLAYQRSVTIKTARSLLTNDLIFKRQFMNTSIKKASKWNNRVFYADGSDRYTRLNRFQQYYDNGNDGKDNSIRNVTIIGLASMVGIYFGSPYLFEYVPGFSYFKTHPKAFVYSLLGVNLAVYGLWQLPRCWGFMQKYMLLQKSRIPSNWSIVGSAFSHQEFWHLGMNMLALWSFGTSIASMLGTANFFSLYMNSAIAGSLFSLWYPRIARMALMGPSLGASGALFGVLGCFSYLVPHAQILLFVFPIPGGAWIAFLGSVAWNAAGCVLRWGSFDYAAHLGGSAIGVLYGWYISKQVEKRRQERFERETRWLR